jgi:hypothetical protein
MAKFHIGDVCVTQNAIAGLLNNGLVVEIRDICIRQPGSPPTYLIRRADGQDIPAVLAPISGEPRYFNTPIAWCAEHKLRSATPAEILGTIEQASHPMGTASTGVPAC